MRLKTCKRRKHSLKKYNQKTTLLGYKAYKCLTTMRSKKGFTTRKKKVNQNMARSKTN